MLNEAETVLVEALKKEGDIDEVNYNLSLIYARKGNFEEAIKKMENCVKLDPLYPNANTWLDDFRNMKQDQILPDVVIISLSLIRRHSHRSLYFIKG